MGLEGYRVIRPTASSDKQNNSWFNIVNINTFIIFFYTQSFVF
jgi:hypothetical protein